MEAAKKLDFCGYVCISIDRNAPLAECVKLRLTQEREAGEIAWLFLRFNPDPEFVLHNWPAVVPVNSV